MPADVITKADVLARVCDALRRGDRDEASRVARAEYAFVPTPNAGRAYTEVQSMRVFARDGFLDRYSGGRLVFPGTLRLLSKVLPVEFPAHPNWKMSESHIMFWELFPTIDHVVPVARGGADEAANWVTTSMVRNAAKSNWLVEELGWSLRPIDPAESWDGLVGWFLELTAARPEYLDDKYLARWRRAAVAVRETTPA